MNLLEECKKDNCLIEIQSKESQLPLIDLNKKIKLSLVKAFGSYGLSIWENNKNDNILNTTIHILEYEMHLLYSELNKYREEKNKIVDILLNSSYSKETIKELNNSLEVLKDNIECTSKRIDIIKNELNFWLIFVGVIY